MVPVQMRVNHDVDACRVNWHPARTRPQAQPFTGFLVVTLAPSRLDQDALTASFHHITIESGGNTSLLIGRQQWLPQCFRDDSEECPAVPPIHTGARQIDAQIPNL